MVATLVEGCRHRTTSLRPTLGHAGRGDRAGTPSDGGGCRQVVCACHAYTGSNPVPATLPLGTVRRACLDQLRRRDVLGGLIHEYEYAA